MATSSLYKDFVITTREEAKGLVDLLDSFDENAPQPQAPSVAYSEPSKAEMERLIKEWREKQNA